MFPDTPGTVPGMGIQDWIDGASVPVPKISLNPSTREESLASHGPPVSDIPRHVTPPAPVIMGPPSSNLAPPRIVQPNTAASPKPSPKPRLIRGDSSESEFPRAAPRPSSTSGSRPSSGINHFLNIFST